MQRLSLPLQRLGVENTFFISEFLSIRDILWRGPREAASRGPLQRMSLMLKNSLIKKYSPRPASVLGEPLHVLFLVS